MGAAAAAARLGLAAALAASSLAETGAAVGSSSRAPAWSGCALPSPSPSAGHAAEAAVRLAFLVDAADGAQDARRARELVEALYAPQHVYILRLPRDARPAFDAWLQERRFANVFATPEVRTPGGGPLLQGLARATQRLLERHRYWDYVLDLPDSALPLLPVGALARWLALLNGTSLPAPPGGGAGGGGDAIPAALARCLVHDVFAELREARQARRGRDGEAATAATGEVSRGARLQRLWSSSGADAERPGAGEAQAATAWRAFWSAVLRDYGCDDGILEGAAALSPFFSGSRGTAALAFGAAAASVRSAPSWGLVSPVQAFDAGQPLEPVSEAWWARHREVVRWLLHALFVQRSHGEQRLQEVHRASWRPQAKPIRVLSRRGGGRASAPKGAAEVAAVSPAGRALRASLQLSVRVTLSPASGICQVPRTASGLLFQLSSCSVEADVFLIERLLATEPSQPACGAAPAVLLRVGTAWDGDREVFDGLTSVIPQDSTRDLWVVVYPIALTGGSKMSLLIEWSDPDDDTLFEGGGAWDAASSARQPGLAWERYLGPSPLEIGTHSVIVRDDSGNVLARRSFEVVGNVGEMSSAKRLELFPQYFELVAEPGAREGMDSVTGLTGSQTGTFGDSEGGQANDRGKVSKEKVAQSAASDPRPPPPRSEHVPRDPPAPSSTPPWRRSLEEELRATRERNDPSLVSSHRNAAQTENSERSGEAKAEEEGVVAESIAPTVPSVASADRTPLAATPSPELAAMPLRGDALGGDAKTGTKSLPASGADLPRRTKKAQASSRRLKLSLEEVQRREREWILRDVERFAMPRLSMASSEKRISELRGSGRSKPQTEEERRVRELEWIRSDVQRHVPPEMLRRARARSGGTRSSSPMMPNHASASRGQKGAAFPSARPAGPVAPAGVTRAAEDLPPPPLPPPQPLGPLEDVDQEELSRRELAWLRREAERLQRSVAARRAAGGGAALEAKATSSQLPPASPKLREEARARTESRQEPRGKPGSSEEWLQREEAWIRRDIELHVPPASRARLACRAAASASSSPAAPGAATSAEEERRTPQASAGTEEERRRPREQQQKRRETRGGGGGSGAMETELEAAAREANVSMEALSQARLSLRDRVPEEAIDRELPWILRDIAVGRSLAAARSHE